MKLIHTFLLCGTLVLCCSCTLLYGPPSDPAPHVQIPKQLAVPVGNNWQIVEEAPHLSGDRGRLPFQTEQSVQPQGDKSGAPADKRTIETTR